jgi:hypothetical protein
MLPDVNTPYSGLPTGVKGSLTRPFPPAAGGLLAGAGKRRPWVDWGGAVICSDRSRRT